MTEVVLLERAELTSGTTWHATGSVSVAADRERFEELKWQASMARVFGLEVELLDPHAITESVPLARVDDLVGGVFLAGERVGGLVSKAA